MMFGHQDDDKHGNKHGEEEGAAETVAPDQPVDAQTDAVTDHQDTQPVDDDHAWQNPGEPADDQQDSPAPAASDDQKDDHEEDKDNEDAAEGDQPGPIRDIIAPAGGGNAQNPVPPMPLNARDLPEDDSKTPHELIDIKQKALGELTPLMGELDLSPEDKFRTLLMIIQASDNQDMIKQAYEAAEDIKDEKVRAQALLDLVNEINYFTQHPQG